MRFWTLARLRIASLLRRSRVEADLDEELRFHLDREIERGIARGMTAEDARLAARRVVGGLDQIKEECRDQRRTRVLENLAQDTRYALRNPRKSPGFLVVAVAALALGIGANTAVFSIVDAVLLRPLPYPDSERLVQIWKTGVTTEAGGDWVSYPDYLDYRRYQRSFTDMALYRYWLFAFGGKEQRGIVDRRLRIPEHFRRSSCAAFARPRIRFRRRCAGPRPRRSDQPLILGAPVQQRSVGGGIRRADRRRLLNADRCGRARFAFPMTIPSSGMSAAQGVDIWVPLPESMLFQERGNHNYWAIGRLGDGVSLGQAQSDMPPSGGGWLSSTPGPTATLELRSRAFWITCTPVFVPRCS